MGLREEKMIINESEQRCEKAGNQTKTSDLRIPGWYRQTICSFLFFSPPRKGESFYRFQTVELQLWRLTDKANNSYLWHKKNDFYFQLGFMKYILKSPLIATVSLHRSHRDYSLSKISNFSIAFILSLLLYSANN